VNPTKKIQSLPLWLALFQPFISKQARGIERQQKHRKNTNPDEKTVRFSRLRDVAVDLTQKSRGKVQKAKLQH